MIGFRSNEFENNSLKTLQEAELRILTSILFDSNVSAGKIVFLKEFVFGLKKGFDFFEHFSYYRVCYFLELVEIDKQMIFN